MKRTIGAVLLTVTGMLATAGEYPDRWVQIRNDITTDSKLAHFEKIVGIAADSGFNGILWDAGADDGEGCDFVWDAPRRARLEEAKAFCREKRMEIVPMIWSVGRAKAILAVRPDLAEGLPVTDVPYIAKRGRAVFAPEGDGTVTQLVGRISTGTKLVLDVKKHHKYRVTGLGGYEGTVEFFVPTPEQRAKGKKPVRMSTSYQIGCLKWQDGHYVNSWRESRYGRGTGKKDGIDVCFDFVSYDNDQEVVYFGGAYRAEVGRGHMDDLKIEEIGVVMPVIRDGCPFVVRNAADGTVYTAGKDYLEPASRAQLERRADTSLALPLPEGSAIREGARLLIDYWTPCRTSDKQAGVCMANPELYRFFDEKAKFLDELFDHPAKWFLSMDEIRCGGTCGLCRSDREENLAKLVAHCLTRQRAALKAVNRDCTIYAWSDMWDPNANARHLKGEHNHDYELCRGQWWTTEYRVPKDIVSVVWQGTNTAEKAHRYFIDNGVPTIQASFYDVRDLEHARNRGSIEMINRIPGCRGMIYSTWTRPDGDYVPLRGFGNLLTELQKPLPVGEN